MLTKLLGTVLFILAYAFIAWLGTAGQRAKPSRRKGVANGVTPQ